VRPSRAHPVSARANTGHGSARSVRWRCDMLPRRRLALTGARAGHRIGPELPSPLPCAAGPGAGTARALSCLRSAGVGPRLPRPARACRTLYAEFCALYAELCVQGPITAAAEAPALPPSPPCSCGGLRACADRHSPLTRPPRLPRPRSCPRARLPRPPAGTATTPSASASTSPAQPAAATAWPASPAAGRSSSSRTPPSPRCSGAAASPPSAPRRTPLASLHRANRLPPPLAPRRFLHPRSALRTTRASCGAALASTAPSSCRRARRCVHQHSPHALARDGGQPRPAGA